MWGKGSAGGLARDKRSDTLPVTGEQSQGAACTMCVYIYIYILRIVADMYQAGRVGSVWGWGRERGIYLSDSKIQTHKR